MTCHGVINMGNTCHVEQKLLSRPEILSSPTVFSGLRVARSLDLCVCFLYIVVCPLSIALSCDLRLLISPLVSSNILVLDWNGQIQHILMSLSVEIFNSNLL